MKGKSIYCGSSVEEGAKAIIADMDKRWDSLPVDTSQSVMSKVVTLSDDDYYRKICEEAALCGAPKPTFKEIFGYDRVAQEESSLKVASLDRRGGKDGGNEL